MSVGGDTDNGVLEEDLGASDDEGHLLLHEVGNQVRDALKLMVLALHLAWKGNRSCDRMTHPLYC